LNLIDATAEEPAIERHSERMTSFSRLVIFDKRGTGLSDRVPAEEMADPARRLEDLIAVMDAVGLPAATLFATADGALIALQFAARFPERVQALVILEGTAKWVASQGYDAGVPLALMPPAEIWDEFWGKRPTLRQLICLRRAWPRTHGGDGCSGGCSAGLARRPRRLAVSDRCPDAGHA
jgi:pimeloyl-ACP methyl ester carboxylesterase